MNNIPLSKDLYIYTGSTFDGCLIIRDIHNNPYFISEGDEITLFIKKADKGTNDEPMQITLTHEDEIMGEYPFKLSAEKTSSLKGDYYYYVFINFADGDKYQIVPHTPLKARIPHGVLCYSQNKNTIIAQVPRIMAKSNYSPSLNELEYYVSHIDDKNNDNMIYIRHINNADIVLIGSNIDTKNITPAELIEHINRKIEYVGAGNTYISGFFHVDEIPEHEIYRTAIKETFKDKFINVEEILKKPILSKYSEMVVSSTAFDLLNQKPKHEDIISIIHNEYPACILDDATHFNQNGCYAAARALLKEVFNHG